MFLRAARKDSKPPLVGMARDFIRAWQKLASGRVKPWCKGSDPRDHSRFYPLLRTSHLWIRAFRGCSVL